ncbi:MAG: type II secretion system F family protein [Dehalococcoidia bacterium]
MLLTVFAALSVAAAAFFGGRAVLVHESGRSAARLQEIASSGEPFDPDADQGTVWDRLVRPLLRGAAERFSALLPTRLAQYFEGQLIVAGDPVTPHAYALFVLLLPAALALGPLVVVLRTHNLSLATFGVLAACLTLGVAAPPIWLKGRIARRQMALVRSLPDAVDLVVVSVEAGLSLEGALGRVAEGQDGPLVQELRRALTEMSLGMGRRRALQGLVDRTQLPSLRSLVSAIVQAEMTGMGIAQVLRAQSLHLRTQRRQRAEEQAMKAPLKMLFPLVFFIFPSLFVVVLGPAVFSLLRALGQ